MIFKGKSNPVLNFFAQLAHSYLLFILPALLLIIFITLGSFLLCILCKEHPALAFFHPLTVSHEVIAFYSPFTRAYELLIGALLAINYDKIRLPQNKIICHLLSLTGLALILFSGLSLQENDFPSIYMLMPCLGAFLIILTGKNDYSLGNKILSNPVFVFIGLISYSLYHLSNSIASLELRLNFK